MTTVFEKSDEWGGYTVTFGSTGFIIDYHTHEVGEIDGLKILVPYGTWNFWSIINLHGPYDDIATNGEALAEKAMRDAGKPVAERSVEVLDQGVVLEKSPKRQQEAASVTTIHLRRGALREDRFDQESAWYTMSLHKEDEVGYGKCHDLFTEFYLAHGMPHGMALWTTSNFDTDENMFFAQIPQGIAVDNAGFFTEFLPAPCPRPSMIGLSLLVGHLDEQPGAHFAEKRRRRWRRSEVAALNAVG